MAEQELSQKKDKSLHILQLLKFILLFLKKAVKFVLKTPANLIFFSLIVILIVKTSGTLLTILTAIAYFIFIIFILMKQKNSFSNLGVVFLMLALIFMVHPLSLKFINPPITLIITIIALIILFMITYTHFFRKKCIEGIFAIVLLVSVPITIIDSLRKDFIKLIFSQQVNPLVLLSLIIAGVFVFLVITGGIKYIFSYISQWVGSKGIKNSFFKKLDNIYFALALTLMIIIALSGFGWLHENYKSDYPLEIDISTEDGVLISPLICKSENKKEYFLDGDTITCETKIFLDKSFRFNGEKHQIEVRNKETLKWGFYNKTEYHFGLSFNDEEMKLIWFKIHKEFDKYKLYIIYETPVKKEGLIEVLDLDVLSNEEYNLKIKERLGVIIGIFTIGLFSVFIIVNNLKGILENKK